MERISKFKPCRCFLCVFWHTLHAINKFNFIKKSLLQQHSNMIHKKQWKNFGHIIEKDLSQSQLKSLFLKIIACFSGSIDHRRTRKAVTFFLLISYNVQKMHFKGWETCSIFSMLNWSTNIFQQLQLHMEISKLIFSIKMMGTMHFYNM